MAMDSNKWLKLISEIEIEKNARQWKRYIEENNFEIILPDIVLGEILMVLTKKEDARIWHERRIHLFRLMKSGQKFDFRRIATEHDEEYYYLKAELFIKKYKTNELLKARGLCKSRDGKELYALHKQDLAIFFSLKELNKAYYFITHDNGLKDALMLAEIRKTFIEEGLCFILIHETQAAKNRQVTRIKIMP